MSPERRRVARPAPEPKRGPHPLLLQLQKDEEAVTALLGKIASGRGSMEELELTSLLWLAVLEDVILPHAAATLKSDAQESVAAASLRVEVLDALMPHGRTAEGAHERRAWVSVVESELAALSADLRNITKLLAKPDLDALHRSASTLRSEISQRFRIQ
jgi:hypothetical protein